MSKMQQVQRRKSTKTIQEFDNDKKSTENTNRSRGQNVTQNQKIFI